jgi:hypothetical protein
VSKLRILDFDMTWVAGLFEGEGTMEHIYPYLGERRQARAREVFA